MQRQINNFLAGLQTDVDVKQQPEGSVRRSVNGRVIFNADGTYAWVNDNGNLLSFQIKAYDGTLLTDYKAIGYAAFDDKVILFSTDNTNSEIGMIDFNADGIGVYKQIYNDQYDYNGELLGFNTSHPISGIVSRETTDIERVYFTDWNNNVDKGHERLCLNVLIGAEFNYTPSGIPLKYPFWYSAHSMKMMCDHLMGVLKFKQKIDGFLKTGEYQYCYRGRTRDGYATPWTPLLRGIMLNSQTIVVGEHAKFQMQPSGIVTVFGIRLIVQGFDTRFPIIEVAYCYSISATQTVEAAIFYTHEFTVPAIGDITVDHTTHSGQPLPFEDLQRQIRTITHARDLNQKDNYLVSSTLREPGILEPDLSAASIIPITKLMDDDTSTLTNVIIEYTQQNPGTSVQTLQLYHTGAVTRTTDFNVINDYSNYQGMQWAHLFASYWRGETYRFAVVVIDIKGNPNFAFHLADYTFPQQYDSADNFTLTKLDGGRYKIQMLGLKVSGIRIPDAVLYDEENNLQVSGFMIVRAARVPKILFQGIIQNTVFEDSDEEDEGGDVIKLITRPLPFTLNTFYSSAVVGDPPYGNNERRYYTAPSLVGRGGVKFLNRESTFLAYPPEILFQSTAVPEVQNPDRIKLVGLCRTDSDPLFGTNYLTANGYYAKHYATNTDHYTALYTLGEESSIKICRTTPLGEQPEQHRIEAYDPTNTEYIYSQWLQCYLGALDQSGTAIERKAWGMAGSLLLTCENFKDLGVYSNVSYAQYFIANYVRPSAEYPAFEDTLYYPTGHFQPINAGVIADTIQGDGSLLFDEVEVWGGDCYPMYFDFARLLPRYSDCEKSSDAYQDYCVGVVHPVESSLNHSMRFGRRFVKDSLEPESTSCEDLTVRKNGIQLYQQEDFDLNDVVNLQENVRFYPAKPSELKNIRLFPAQSIVSMLKFYGEPLDHYRLNLVNDFLNLTGEHGCISGTFCQDNFIYFLQSRAFGRYFFNEKALLQNQAQGTLLVGQGDKLTGAWYIDERVGCQHHFGRFTTDRATFWVDANMSKLYRFAGNGLEAISDLYGMHNEFFTVCRFYRDIDLDDPTGVGGIGMCYDYKNNNLLVTFQRIKVNNDESVTLSGFNKTYVWDDNLSRFCMMPSYMPKFWMSFRNFYFSADKSMDNTSKIYVHLQGAKGEYYGVLEDSILQFVVNMMADESKVYHVEVLNVNDGYTLIGDVNMDTQSQSRVLNLPTDARVKYREGKLWFPLRETDQPDRMRGEYMLLTLNVVNDGVTEIRLTDARTEFNLSPKY